MIQVAALFVDPRGPYPKIEGVECWDKARDARFYRGPHPVVAHPPCGRWCKLAPLNQRIYGHAVGDDGGLFASALAHVRRWGGVLEHPAESIAWSRFGLVAPLRRGWSKTLSGEWVCEVAQSAYGHRAQKRTWLLYIGREPITPRWEQPRGEVVIGGSANRSARPANERMWDEEARRTPPAFAEFLVQLARSAVSRAGEHQP